MKRGTNVRRVKFWRMGPRTQPKSQIRVDKPTPKNVAELVRKTRELDERRGVYPLQHRPRQASSAPKPHPQVAQSPAQKPPHRKRASPEEKANIQAQRSKWTTPVPVTVAADLQPNRQPRSERAKAEQELVDRIMSSMNVEEADRRNVVEAQRGVPRRLAKKAERRKKKRG